MIRSARYNTLSTLRGASLNQVDMRFSQGARNVCWYRSRALPPFLSAFPQMRSMKALSCSESFSKLSINISTKYSNMPPFLKLTGGMSHVTHPASLLRLLPSDLTRYSRKSKSRNGRSEPRHIESKMVGARRMAVYSLFEIRWLGVALTSSSNDARIDLLCAPLMQGTLTISHLLMQGGMFDAGETKCVS
jgi:hypothetical protein